MPMRDRLRLKCNLRTLRTILAHTNNMIDSQCNSRFLNTKHLNKRSSHSSGRHLPVSQISHRRPPNLHHSNNFSSSNSNNK